MSKIVCDICGTAYPDTATECPICGCTPDVSAALLADTMAEEEVVAAAPVEKAEEAPAPVVAPVVYDDDDDDDFDDDDDEDEDDDFDDDDDEDDEEEEGHKSNAFLVILLVLVILALLAVSAFILVKYVAPNLMGPKETAPATVQTTEAAPTETTELVIPCENLALTSGGEIILGGEGANWLINVLALPENTTDVLTYSSSDESVAIVNEQGKITAVGEGTAVITITCGQQELKCTVTCTFTPETTVPVETTVPTEPSVPTEPEETTAPTEPEETTEPTEPETTAPDVVIYFVKDDVTSKMIGEQFYLKVRPSDVDASLLTWSSENERICVVDQKGLVTIKGRGTTHVVVTYGDQVIKCIVRVI